MKKHDIPRLLQEIIAENCQEILSEHLEDYGLVNFSVDSTLLPKNRVEILVDDARFLITIEEA